MLNPLASGEDPLPGLHGNTQIPKVLGCARLFELTGEPRWRTIAERFLELVLQHHTYSNGGHGSGEHFGKPGELGGRLSNTNCETCNTHNMLRLARYAFSWEPRATLADFMERGLVNHVLASQRPTDGMVAYFTPLQSGRFRTWSTADDSFWCCVGTGLENHARYAEYVAWADDQTLWLSGAVPGSVTLPGGSLELELDQNPGRTRAIVHRSGPVDNTPDVRLRRPHWLDPGDNAARFSVSGVEFAEDTATADSSESDGFWVLPSTVKLEISLPSRPRFEPLPDMPDRMAVCDGPFLLAVDQGPAPVDSLEGAEEDPDALIPPAPVVVDAAPDPARVRDQFRMVPFQGLWDRRTAVYLDCFTPESWQEREAAYRAGEAADHRSRTRWLDAFWPFQMQPERDHGFACENTIGGERSAWKFREARPGGWFSAVLRCDPNHDIEVLATWGPPVDGIARTTVSVDSVEIGAFSLAAERHRHIEMVFTVPSSATRGKSSVTVRVDTGQDGPSPPLFLLRTRKADHPLPESAHTIADGNAPSNAAPSTAEELP